ncbi:hypothetical protein F5Y16DRAFT_391227 [Xylariaceae sp. FL0255]|nr:hypothetical protein F5Y16DRAFT_391227 [Xylariaceae sp. FL0255]
MAQSIRPSKELLQLMTSISLLKPDAITRQELKNVKGERSEIDISTVTWPPQSNALVRQAVEKAAKESISKIKQLAPKSKEWQSNTCILRKGMIAPFKGRVCLVIPLLQTHDLPKKVIFHPATKEPGEPKQWEPEKWEQLLYILGPGTCIHAEEGELMFIVVLCE